MCFCWIFKNDCPGGHNVSVNSKLDTPLSWAILWELFLKGRIPQESARPRPLGQKNRRTIERDKLKSLNLFVKTGCQYFYEKFRTLRNNLKHTVCAKTQENKDSLREPIEDSLNDQKLFSGLIRKISGSSLVKTNIPAKSWYDYYSALPNSKPNNVNLSFDRFMQSYISTHERNCSICSGKDSSESTVNC